jgi:hypothetical protein
MVVVIAGTFLVVKLSVRLTPVRLPEFGRMDCAYSGMTGENGYAECGNPGLAKCPSENKLSNANALSMLLARRASEELRLSLACASG